MINYHPALVLLKQFVQGELPASLAAAVSIHAEMCSQCQAIINELTEQCAEAAFEISGDSGFEPGLNLDAMIDNITSSDEIDVMVSEKQKVISVPGKDYILPRALSNIGIGKWARLGKIARSRLDLNEGELRASLLQIQAGGHVPEHTHKGFELTLLLDGSFKDDIGEYGSGDFIMLDGNHAHSPVTEHGCLCYTVSNDAQYFTRGINKLLNPFGSFIY